MPRQSAGAWAGILSWRDSMRGKICSGVITLLVLGVVALSEARVNSLTGGVDVGLDIDRRTNRGAASGQSNDYNTVFTTPSFSFTSSDIKDGINFRYAPSFRYDLNGKGTNVDQNLNLSVQRLLTKVWQIRISELYVNADDSSLTSTPPSTANNPQTPTNTTTDQISNELGRRRFSTNNASLTSDYTYLQDSVVSLGYTYSLLRNDGAGTLGFQDYDKHSGLLSVSYRFNPEWKTTVGGQYVRGLYETQSTPTLGAQSDLSEYHGDMSLESVVFSKNILSLSYGYVGTRYDDPTRKDSDIHNTTVGWKREISPHLNADIGAGPSYVKTDGQDATWGYNAHANVNYMIEHGRFGIGVAKTYSQDNFTGTSTGGTIDSWTAKGDFNYQLYEKLSTGVFASYADQNRQNAVVGTSHSTISYKEKVSSTGINMNYSFWRWYTLSIGYTFSRQEAESTLVNSFDDNRVYMTIGAQKELFRW